jgi:ribonuclease BN (tRNA processing enzyme)
MKIKFWGTAAGLAERGRHCTSMRVQVGGEYYIIDFGAPVEYMMANEGIKPSDIRAGFITHMHSDHVDALPSFAKLYAQFTNFIYAPASVDMFLPDGIEALLSWLGALRLSMSERMRFHLMGEGLIYDNGRVRVRAIPTEHLGKGNPCYAYVFEADGKRVLFSGDITDDFHDFPRGEHYDLVICELAHGQIGALKKCLAEADFDRLIFNHMSTDPWILEKVQMDRIGLLEKEKDALGFAYELAYDGLEVEV